MAVRSGSNTGLIVALVVFVMAFLAMLTMTFIFYAGKNTAEEERAEAERILRDFITRDERASDAAAAVIQQAAGPPRVSVFRYQQQRLQDMSQYMVGNRNATSDQVRRELAGFGIPEDGVVQQRLREMTRQMTDNRDQIEALRGQVQQRDQELADLQRRREQLEQQHRAELARLRESIGEYERENQELYANLRTTRDNMRAELERQSREHAEQANALDDQIEALNQDNFVLRGRLRELESVLSEIRIRVQDPSRLVDGRIIEISGPNEVFIDLGARDRIVLGMTFEVFESESAIGRIDQRTGRLPRGKASLEIIRVHEDTSTAKITRSTPGRPVVRDDVIANAVYDRNYRFKFLIHGRFDVTGDGRATAEEAEYLSGLVRQWGGEVVEGATIPGDLDFLVLGEEPMPPSPLPANYTQRDLDRYLEQRRVRDDYLSLFNQAREAQIPVLNANRFFIMTGMTRR